MKKITILALHLGYGGIEKFITNLANSLCDDYKVEIISTYKLYDKPFFKLSDNITVSYLISNLKPNKTEVITSFKKFKFITTIKEIFKSIKILYLKKYRMIKYIKRCDSDVVITTRDIHNKWLGKYGNKNIIKIGSEHNHHNYNKKYIKKVVDSTKGLNYFVVVSKELQEFYSNKVYSKCIYIPNTIDKISTNVSKLKNKNIISVGRLEKVKGYSDLIDVMQIVVKQKSDWVLNIVGSGSEYNLLKNKIKEKNLENNIKLLGYKTRKELDKLYSESSIYLMGSISESFGLVLLEAMSYGIPCVAFSSARGACEVIDNNVTGYLIENRDKQEMANKIIELIDNMDKRKKMGKNGYEKSKEYLSSNIKWKWIDLIEK